MNYVRSNQDCIIRQKELDESIKADGYILGKYPTDGDIYVHFESTVGYTVPTVYSVYTRVQHSLEEISRVKASLKKVHKV